MSGQPTCKRCAPRKKVKMRLGKAIGTRKDSLSKLVECFKCPECGHSVRIEKVSK